MIDTLYVKKKSFLHLFDCRLKLLLLPGLIIYYFLPLPLFLPFGLLLFSALLLALALGVRDVILPVKMIFPLLLLILVLTPFFHREGAVIWSLGKIYLLTTPGAIETAVYLVRFTGITLTFFILFRTTSMEDLLLGLRWFRLPYLMTLVISVALRYIPHLAGLFHQVRAAHSLRCSVNDPPASKGILDRFNHFFPVLVSLMIQSVKTIPTLTMALELKGVGRDNTRSRFRRLAPPVNPAGQILSAAGILAAFCLTLVVWL